MIISVVTPRFKIAGVPLAQVRFARALAELGHEVHLVIGFIEAGYKFPPLGPVKVFELGHEHVRSMVFPLRKHFLSTMPDIIFSAEDHLNVIVLLAAILAGSKAKISCSSRVTPFDTYSNTLFSKRWALKQLMRSLMWRASALTCVSQDMVRQYRQIFKTPRHLCVYNIVCEKGSKQRMQEHVEHEWFSSQSTPVIIAAGLLAPWKGFADLIFAMRILRTKRLARLVILGDGPLRAELERLVVTLCMEDSVKLMGYVDNPLKYFARSRVFVLSSHVEGLPNVLVEAMMCGCTPVSTDCPTGPREVLQDGRYGYLVPIQDPDALAAGIERALDQPIPMARLAEAVKPFEDSAVLKRHFEVLGLAEH
jgi:glycosyltransferase involved in cell wall biosynthesis